MTDEPDSRALLARIDERTANTDRRLNNLDLKLDTFVTQRELASTHDRLKSLEDGQRKFGWAIIGSWIALIGNAIYGKL